MNTPQELWQAAVNAFQQNRFQDAVHYGTQIPQFNQSLAVLKLLAQSERKLGDLDAAHKHLLEALTLQPKNPELKNLLGNLYKERGLITESEKLFLGLIKEFPREFTPLYNLALLYKSADRFGDALVQVEKALKINPDSINAQVTKAQCLTHQQEYKAAGSIFKSLLNKSPNNLLVLQNYSNMLRSIGDYDAAEELLLSVRAIAPEHPLLNQQLASLYALKGEFEKSDRLYQQCVEQQPENIVLLDGWSRLYWNKGRQDWERVYKDAIHRTPNNLDIIANYAVSLVKADENSKALELILDTQQKGLVSCAISTLHGYLLRENGDVQNGLDIHEKAVLRYPHDIELQKEYGTSLLAAQRYDDALKVFDKLVAASPEDRGLIAYLCTALRLSGNFDRLAELHDFNNFVQPHQIDVPPGYSSISEFNQQLKSDLMVLHHQQAQRPIDQSLRSGTQTQGNLFDMDIPSVQLLKAEIEKKVQEYNARLQRDNSHPLLQHVGKAHRFSCSWSVRLQDHGFHKNHFHHKGWISSAYYVSLPDEIDDQQKGWIKFGQPEISSQIQLEPEHVVKPKEGCLVLFPSYMWHGTIPYDSAKERMTVAFDVVPVG